MAKKVKIPIIGKIVPDKKLGNKVIYETNTRRSIGRVKKVRR